jgi:hypothetical protein
MKPRGFLIVLILSASAGKSAAQVHEEFTPTERKQLTVVTEPQTLYKGFLRSGISSNYSTIDKVFAVDGKRESLPSNIWADSWNVAVSLMYGISNRLQADISLPYRYSQIYQSVRQEAPEISSVQTKKWSQTINGLGDISATAAFQLITEEDRRPSQTIFASVRLPTGEKNPRDVKNEFEYSPGPGSGEAAMDMTYRLRKTHYPYVYSFYVSYQHFFGGKKLLHPTDNLERLFKSGSNVSFGGYYIIHLNDWIALRNSIDSFFSYADTYDKTIEENNSWVIQCFPGLNFQISQFRIAQGVTVPLWGSFAAADPNYTVILQYTF